MNLAEARASGVFFGIAVLEPELARAGVHHARGAFALLRRHAGLTVVAQPRDEPYGDVRARLAQRAGPTPRGPAVLLHDRCAQLLCPLAADQLGAAARNVAQLILRLHELAPHCRRLLADARRVEQSVHQRPDPPPRPPLPPPRRGRQPPPSPPPPPSSP